MVKRVTLETIKRLEKELDFLKKIKRKEISEKLRHAISFGDLKENAAYHEAKDEQAFLEGKIIDLENKIKNSSVISEGKKSGKILVGSKVLVIIKGEKKEYEIVETIESDPLKGKISLESPIGETLLGRKKKDSCQFKTPSGEKIKIEILEVN